MEFLLSSHHLFRDGTKAWNKPSVSQITRDQGFIKSHASVRLKMKQIWRDLQTRFQTSSFLPLLMYI